MRQHSNLTNPDLASSPASRRLIASSSHRLIARFASPHLTNIWLILAFSLFAWGPLLTPAYFFNAHDARHSVFFLVEFDQTWRDGYLWPRWSPDFAFGYGYPLFNLYAPLAFYAAELLHLLSLGFTTAIKTMYVLATISAGLGMYGFTQHLFGRPAGLLAAMVYMYAPFRLVEIFVRSAYAEFVALAMIPFLFWAFTELVATPTLRRMAVAGFIYGLLALTHPATFFTFTPFLTIYLLYLILAKTRLNLKAFAITTTYVIIAGALGLALAAIYLIPVVIETRYVKIEQWTSGSYNYLQHFVYFSQFFSPEWGYGYAGVGLTDDFSYQLGMVVIALFSFAGVHLLTSRFPHQGTALFFSVSTLVIIFLMSLLAEPIWQVIPIAILVQFPWRLLGLTAFTLSIVAGSLLTRVNGQSHGEATHSSIVNDQLSTGIESATPTLLRFATIHYASRLSTIYYLLCLVIVLASFPYTLPQYTDVSDWAETPLAVIYWDRASIVDRVGMVSATQEQPQTSPLEQQYLRGEPLTAASLIAGQGSVETLHRGGASSRVRVIAAEPVTLQFYTYDYPGWQVTLDGQLITHGPEPPYGLITVDLPAGEHSVLLKMESTPARTWGAIISGLALLTIIALFFWPNHQTPITNHQLLTTDY